MEKSNWTGRAVVVNRSQLDRALARDGLRQPGVYVLTGPAEDSTPASTSARPYIHDQRQQLQESGVLIAEDGQLLFTQDFRFTSPSTAAGVLVGGAVYSGSI